MKNNRAHLLIFFAALFLAMGCKGPGGNLAQRAGNRGMAQVRRWMRYEFGRAKSFSYGTSQIREGVTVIGYEPSWLIYDSLYQTYRFEFLTDLAIGEYDINPKTGFARYDSARIASEVKNIVEFAGAGNSAINVLMSVNYYGDYGDQEERQKFLSEPAKKNVIKTLDLTLDDFSARLGEGSRQRVGVLLDFQNIARSKWREFPKFIQRLKQALNKPDQDKHGLIYVVAPLVPVKEDWFRDSTVLKRVARLADKMIFRAHSFRKQPQMLGPLAPVYQDTTEGWYHDIDFALSNLIDTIGLDPAKVVVEFPYYGLNWYDSTALSNVSPMLPVSQMMLFAADTPSVYPDSAGAFFVMDDSLFTFEDTTTLNWKYKYVDKRGIAGIGLYGLGYAYGFNPLYEDKLWEIIGDNFGEKPPRLFFPGVSFFLSFFFIGIIFSAVRQWQVRFALNKRRRKFWYYILMLTLLALTAVVCYLPIEKVSVFWKIIAICVLIIIPLGKKVAMLLLKVGRK